MHLTPADTEKLLLAVALAGWLLWHFGPAHAWTVATAGVDHVWPSSS